jgi:hypothetical protein
LAAILAERAEAEAVASDIPDIPDLSEDMEADGEDGELFPPPVDVESTADEVTLDADPAPEVPMGPPQPGPEARAFAEARGLRRNDPCPCGSGNKFKKCCLKPENDPVPAEA